MHLFLIHHGVAVGPEEDARRPLSAVGLAGTARIAAKAAALGAKPDVVWHSGKLRAKQTAEAFWRRCNPLAAFSVVRGLQPADPTGWIRDAIILEQEASRDVLLVGHFPQLPQLLADLAGERADAMPSSFPMNGMVALENVDGRWVELWRSSRSPESGV